MAGGLSRGLEMSFGNLLFPTQQCIDFQRTCVTSRTNVEVTTRRRRKALQAENNKTLEYQGEMRTILECRQGEQKELLPLVQVASMIHTDPNYLYMYCFNIHMIL